MKNNSKWLNKLSRLVASDILGSRPCQRVDTSMLDKFASSLQEIANEKHIVYTAFDGDHQMFCSHMRKAVLSRGQIPANPDSLLGYKDTVSYRQSKRGVLLDDLSMLKGCDELWVFTNLPPDLKQICSLAEGVLIELLFFKKRYQNRPIKFVKLDDVVMEGETASLQDFNFTYSQIVLALEESQKDEILSLANSGKKTDSSLRNVVYYLFDPLDYKYSRFVREQGYTSEACPLIPFLAIRSEDFSDSAQSLVLALIAWVKLMDLAGQCYKLPPLDDMRGTSQVVEVLERVWLRQRGNLLPKDAVWENFGVPKARQREKWAITQKERDVYEP